MLDRGGAERVAGDEQEFLAFAAEFGGELADRRRLAGAVHADDENDEGLLLRIDLERLGDRRQNPFDLGRENGLHLIDIDILVIAALADFVANPQCRGNAEIGADQHVFELIERRRIELAFGEDLGEAAADRLRRARQAVAEARPPALFC